MSKIIWDPIGEHFYKTGCDRGVLFPFIDGKYSKGVGWNGLSAVNESPSGAEPTKLYANNKKYLEIMSAEEFGFTIEAYTYPDEFAICIGEKELEPGVKLTQQSRKPFGLVYRTLIGNDTETDSHGYEIHVVYGAIASPSEKNNESINEDPNVETMSWECTTTPVDIVGFKPSSHIIIDSTKVAADKLLQFEEIIYGKDPTTTEAADGVDPRLPLPDEISTIFKTGGIG